VTNVIKWVKDSEVCPPRTVSINLSKQQQKRTDK
jgi:hypothetical protein